MILSESEDHFYIGPSTIPEAGQGLFASVPLAEGDQFEVMGVLIRAGSISDECSHYADAYKFRVGKFLLLPLGFGGMVNHSRRPNLKKVLEGPRVYLRALSQIKKGEELLFTYSQYAQRRFGLHRLANKSLQPTANNSATESSDGSHP